jgi:hypothetical protein
MKIIILAIFSISLISCGTGVFLTLDKDGNFVISGTIPNEIKDTGK